MGHSRLALVFCLLVVFTLPGLAQKGESYGALLTPQVRSGKLSTPEHLRTYVFEGKLRLGLRDAVVLTLENNSFVRVQESGVEFSKFALLGAHAPFDPVVTGSYFANNSTFPPQITIVGTGVTAASKSIMKNAAVTPVPTNVLWGGKVEL